MPFLAHVRYVSDPDDGPALGTWELLSRAFDGALGWALLAGTVLAVLAYVFVLPRLRRWGAFRVTLHAALADYITYLPWILRLSAGIALIGAGVGHYLFVPHVPIGDRGVVAFLLLGSGFMLLIGLAVRAAALVGLLLWGYVVARAGADALLASEVVVMLVVLTSISAGKPSVDHLLARTLPSAPRWLSPASRLRVVLGPEAERDVTAALGSWVPVVMRAGLGVSLLYAGLAEKILDPGPALFTAERYGLVVGPLTGEIVVVLAGAIEILLGLGLIVGVAVRPLAVLAFLVLTATLFLLPDDPVVPHVPLWGAASAVFILGCGPLSLDRARVTRMVAASD